MNRTPSNREGPEELRFLHDLAHTTGRRRFLEWSGLTLAVVALGCSDDDDDPGGVGPDTGANLGTGDTGVLNYAYALEQLEAAFYTQVTASFYSGATAEEQDILADIRNHEVIHRDFLRTALGAAAIPDLEVDFSSVDFGDRGSVLGAAKTFEDLGVSAYNGAGKLLTDAGNLLAAGRIVSVEARHAATIRDLLVPKSDAPGSFAGDDTVDPASGLEIPERSPSQVLTAADPFVVTTINASGLPTT